MQVQSITVYVILICIILIASREQGSIVWVFFFPENIFLVSKNYPKLSRRSEKQCEFLDRRHIVLKYFSTES